MDRLGRQVGDVPSIPLEVAKIVRAGHQAVVANGNQGQWYLNDGWGNGAANALWDDVYRLDPLNGTDGLLTPRQHNNRPRLVGPNKLEFAEPELEPVSLVAPPKHDKLHRDLLQEKGLERMHLPLLHMNQSEFQ